jgi:hypothetical protein
VALGTRSIAAIADILGPKPFFMGSGPSGVDATMSAFVAGALCPHFDTPLRSAGHENLRRYVGRMTGHYYPELGEITGCEIVEHPSQFAPRPRAGRCAASTVPKERSAYNLIYLHTG